MYIAFSTISKIVFSHIHLKAVRKVSWGVCHTFIKTSKYLYVIELGLNAFLGQKLP